MTVQPASEPSAGEITRRILREARARMGQTAANTVRRRGNPAGDVIRLRSARAYHEANLAAARKRARRRRKSLDLLL